MKKPLMEGNQSIIDSLPLPYQSMDAKASIIHVNKAWLDLLGYSRKEVINKWFGDFLTQDSANLLRKRFPIFITEGKVRGVEYTLIGKDGRELAVSFDGNIEFDEKNQFKRTHCFFKDITERKLISEKLLKNENRYSELFNNVNSGVAVYEAVENGRDFTFTDFNKAAEKIDKIPREKVIGRKVTEVFPSIREMTLLDSFQRVWKTGKPEYHPATIYEDNRLVGWRENYVYKLPTGEIVAIYEDITERKRAEETLHQYSHIVSSSTDMMALLDKQFIYLAANPAYTEAFSLSTEQLIGRTVVDVFGEEFFNTTIKPNADRCLGGEEVNYQDWFDLPAYGRLFMDITYNPFYGEGNKIMGFVVTGRDITERKQTEQEIELLLALSRQASAETSLKDLLFFIADQIVEVITPAEAASVFLYDKERNVNKVQAWAGFTDSEIKGLEFEIEGSQVDEIFRTKKPALTKDVSKASDFELIDGPNIRKIKSQIAVPLIFKKSIIGTMYADNLTMTDAFSQKNLDLLESIGNQLSGVIENARLLDQVSENHKQLGESEERLSKAQRLGHLGFAEWNLKTGRILLSDETRRIHGFDLSKNMIAHEVLMKAIHPDDREIVKNKKELLLKNGEKTNFDHRIVLPDGKIRWVNKQTEITSVADGSPEVLLGTVMDITERRMTLEELRQRTQDLGLINTINAAVNQGMELQEILRIFSEKTREIFSGNGATIYLLSKDQKKLIMQESYLPPAIEKQLKKLIGMKIPQIKLRLEPKSLYQQTLLDEKSKLICTPAEIQAMLNEFVSTAPLPAKVRAGIKKLVPQIQKILKIKSVILVPLLSADKAIGMLDISSMGVFTESDVERLSNITEQITSSIVRVQSKEKLRQSEELYHSVVEDSPGIISKFLPDGTITFVNQEYCRFFGIEYDKVIGTNIQSTIPEENIENVMSSFSSLSNESPIRSIEIKNIKQDGEIRWMRWTDRAIFDNEGQIITIQSFGEDITERKRAEQLLNALNQASVVIGTALTHKEIFNVIAEELKQLDISCMLFPIDETQSKLATEYLGYESKALIAAEKLVGIKHEDFSIPIDAIDLYREVVREKKAIYGNETEKILLQVLPKFPKKLFDQIIKILHVQSSISVPLIVEDQVIGVFSVQSDNLNQEDVPAITAFAHQLSSAWNKTKLLRDLRQTVDGTIHTIAATVEARDPYTAGHQVRVSDLAAAIANEMHLSNDRVEGIKMTGVIHDLGKVQIPAEILSKPGKISELEYKIIQTHSRVGFDLLKEIDFPWPIAQMVLQHHEKMDSSGYPQGLKGDEILLEARILAVADVVEAMSSHRPYRPALGIEKALGQIRKDRGKQLDPEVVDACLKVFKEGYQLIEN